MPIGLIDGGLVLTFGALVAADGLARVNAGAIVMESTRFQGWRFAPPADRSSFRLISPLSPLWRGVVLEWAPADPVSADEFEQRYDRVSGRMRGLVAIGTIHLPLFVAGVPAFTAYQGGSGLIASVSMVTLIGVMTAFYAHAAMRALGPGVGDGFWSRLARGLSPFGAAAAANDVLQATVRNVPAAIVAKRLLFPEEFERFIRPYAVDHLEGAADPMVVAAIGNANEIARIASAEPPRQDAMSAAYCPRCGSEFATTDATCAACARPVVAFRAQLA